MAAGDSQVSVINIGLAALGEDPITDVDAPLKRAIGMKGAWIRVRRETLELHPWRFAKRFDKIAASTTPPPFGYTTAYDFPADFIRPFDIDPETGGCPGWGDTWERVGNQLYCNLTGALNLELIYDHDNIAQWPPAFCKAFGLKLALDQCLFITGSLDKKVSVQKDLDEAMPVARTISAQSARPTEWDGDILLRSRY